MMKGYCEGLFLEKLDIALEQIRKVLSNTRNPQIFSSDNHNSYQDKYTLVEYLTNSSISSIIKSLYACGFTDEQINTLLKWSKDNTVTLSFNSSETTVFDRKEIREEKGKVRKIKKRKSKDGTEKTTKEIITTVEEFFWKFTANWKLSAYYGTNIENEIVIFHETCTCDIKTRSKESPKVKKNFYPVIETDITIILNYINENKKSIFSIDRSHKECHTPSRNKFIDNIVKCYTSLYKWASNIDNHIKQNIIHVNKSIHFDVSCINANDIFNPVLPIFDNSTNMEMDNNAEDLVNNSIVIPLEDIHDFMNEQDKSMKLQLSKISNLISETQSYISTKETTLLITLHHISNICQYYMDGIQYVENMLKNQLITAIGKTVTKSDLDEYMNFHNKKLFNQEYQPKLFSYSIRRDNHYPEGILSLETSDDKPISTLVKHFGETLINFPINAATTINCKSKQYIHGWVNHEFSNSTTTCLNLIARARQFSSFILLIGNVVSSNTFNPQDAIIIKNKDDLLIPLILEQIPTPKSFRDSIESLSPEQQRFAKAFRSMQLQSSLFGICIIQIKPQLEKLLNIPEDSLTKEIQLTQDLMKLFITYQVPSDLLSFQSSKDNLDVISQIKIHVKSIQDMIEAEKEKEIKEAIQKHQFTNFEDEDEDDSLEHRCFGVKAKRSRRSSVGRGRGRGRGGSAGAIRHSAIMRDQCNFDEITTTQSSINSIVSPSNSEISTPHNKTVIIESTNPSDKLDISNIPTLLDSSINEFDIDNSLHSTIIKTSPTWTKKSQTSLLASPTTSSLHQEEKKKEKNQAFDLLDALSRSGSLEISNAEFHVIIASTHHFDNSLIDTIIKENVNPIEKIERSTLIIASTIHNSNVKHMINSLSLKHISESCSQILLKNE